MVNFLLDTQLTVEQLDYCHTISSSSDGLLTVINDILDLSKVEAGMMRLNFEWFRIHGVIEDANELLSTMAIAKNIELNFVVEEDVPAIVCGDRVRLRQVLLNVIGVGQLFSTCMRSGANLFRTLSSLRRRAKCSHDALSCRMLTLNPKKSCLNSSAMTRVQASIKRKKSLCSSRSVRSMARVQEAMVGAVLV